MDTVVLRIYGPNNFQIKHLNWYVPELIPRTYRDISSSERESKQPYLRHFTFRPPRQDRYRPKIEIFETLTKDKDAIRYVLKLEFSVPKLLYGNSLQEIAETDKDKIFTRLQASLLDAGIKTEIKAIANASVSAVHFCKNIPLPSTIQMREILDELERVDINKTVDVSDTRTKKGGRVLNVYSGTIERSFYEKISDCIRPKNKRTDKARINRERDFVESNNLQNLEVFRYEYRVKKTQTVKRELNQILDREPLTPVCFEDLFSPNTFKTAINQSWKELIEIPVNQLVLLGPVNRLTLFIQILKKAKEQGGPHSLNKGLIGYGLATLTLDHGAKEIKGAIGHLWNQNHSERLAKKIAEAADLTKELPYSNNISFIDSALEKFELVTLTSLQMMVQ